MADANAVQAAPPSPKKAAAKPKGRKPPTKQADHPPYRVMVKQACAALKERKGASRQKITSYIKANFKVGEKPQTFINPAIKAMVKSGDIVHTKGTGASGSFKLAKKEAVSKQKKKPAAKKPAAKKTTAKKTTKKPKVKKVVKKATPKKAKAKSTGKPKVKKSVKKPVAVKSKKPKATKKPKIAKKSPAKKPVKKAKTAKPKTKK